jgi:peptidoglycan/LPS O-acetylase OafA/YrhL
MRAVAVVGVVLFHAGAPGVRGGFAGVDVFYVLSGFLITGMLRDEVRSRGTVAVTRFYAARARRLLPAAGLVIAVTGMASAVLLPPLQAWQVLGDGVASALYGVNFRLAARGTDYLAADAAPSPFQHFWSLGVEEQFYLLWPPLLIAVAWLARKYLRDRTVAAPAATLAGLAVASFSLGVRWTTTLPSWAFFSLPTRAWELAAGGLVALAAPALARMPARTATTAAGWIGLGLVALAFVRLDSRTPYPGTAALLPVAGTALVVAAGCLRATPEAVGQVLALPPMRLLGRVSYSWYLWHWPVLLLAPALLHRSLGLCGRLVAAAVSLGFAVLTLRLLEDPVRHAESLRRSPIRGLAVGGAVSAAAAVAMLAAGMLIPSTVGRGAAATKLVVEAAKPTAVQTDPWAAAVRRLTAQVQNAVVTSTNIVAVPSNLTPDLSDAATDKAEPFVNGCLLSWLSLDQGECASGDADSPTTVALIGDSHAAMWYPAMEAVAEQRHWRLETLTKVTCPPFDLPLVSPYLGREYTECEQWRGEITSRLRAEHPKLVVLGMSRRYAGDFHFTVFARPWLDALAQTIATLRAAGSAVLVLGPVPDPHSTVPICLSAHLDDSRYCATTPAAGFDAAGVAAETTATTAAGGHYADLTALFCTPVRCPVIIGNELVFRDDNHLTAGYAATLAPVIGALADQAISEPTHR